VPRSADTGVDSLWCLPRGYRGPPRVRGRKRSAAPSINPTGDRRNVGVEVHERRSHRRAARARSVWSGAAARRSGDVHAARPPFDPGSPSRCRRGGGWSRAPTVGGGRSHVGGASM